MLCEIMPLFFHCVHKQTVKLHIYVEISAVNHFIVTKFVGSGNTFDSEKRCPIRNTSLLQLQNGKTTFQAMNTLRKSHSVLIENLKRSVEEVGGI